MRRPLLCAPAVLLCTIVLVRPLAAQNSDDFSRPRRMLPRSDGEQPRAALGITMAGSTSMRDTLGLLVSSVVPNSPAERAGIEEGDRIASINGVNLRVDPVDAGDFATSNAMSRRLTRELEKVRPGDQVDLRVYSSGETRTVRVRTAESDSLYGRRVSRYSQDDRAALGFGLASTHTRRDTLGVLVMFVDDSGPAAQAGIEEGNRIAAINGVDLRVARDDAADDQAAMSKVRRLQREVARLHPGDDVELRVYANGRFHTMDLRAGRAADLSARRGALMIPGAGFGGAPMGLRQFDLDGAMIPGQIRESIERAMEGANRALEGMGRGLERTRIYLPDETPDEAPRAEPLEPIQAEPLHMEPLQPGQLRFRVPSPQLRLRSAVLGTPEPDVMTALAVSDDASSLRNGSSAVDTGGLRMVPIGDELATYLGAGSERGLLVIAVPQWAHHVLHAGDVVLRIDGRAVRPTADEVTVAIPRLRDVQLDILREGMHHSVTLPARR